GRSGEAERLARNRGHSGGAGWAASPLRAAPLRRVVEVRTVSGVQREVLACGHEIGVRHDMIGETYAARRRCGECLALATAGEKVPEVEPESVEDREARLVARAAGEASHPLRRIERCGDTPTALLEAVVALRAALWPGASVTARRVGVLRWGDVLDLDLACQRLLRRRGLGPAAREAAIRVRAEIAGVDRAQIVERGRR
ncbi:MAG: hypothetical protein ACYCR4_11685, partial [Acidimicrobiales bacterium]